MRSSERLLVKGGRVLTPYEVVESGCVLIEGGKIVAVGPEAAIAAVEGVQVIDARGKIIAPGFIDIHVHGAMGHDTMDATPEALQGMARYFVAHGVTSFLPTIITAPPERIMAAIENVEACREKTGGAEVLGIHLEGPYISLEKRGAQPKEYIRPADPAEYEPFFAKGKVKLITLAPEIPENKGLIVYASQQGATVAVGHSAASYEEVLASVPLGLTHAAHTFNAMLGLHHRQPGTVGAVLTCDGITAEVIADNIHLHPAAVKLLVRAKRVNRTVLVTDAMRATGMADGLYDLGGQEIRVKEGVARMADGGLAGSTLTMERAIKNVMAAAGVTLGEALKMATCNPARVIGVEEEKGSLAPGKDADLTVLDEDLTVELTMVKGQIVYQAKEHVQL